MSSVSKANDFMRLANSSGWKPSWSASKDHEFVEVTAVRGSEKIVIEWMSNQLNCPPKYSYNGVVTGLHSAAVAKRTLQAAKPDIEAFRRRSRAAAAKLRVQTPLAPSSSTTDTVPEPVVEEDYYSLPFDIHSDSDGTILKAIRGNTIVWRNSITGNHESEFVPYKAGDRVFNYDLKNVFYLAQANTGRDYLSFMNINGVFRAVALEALVGVV